MHKTNDIVLVHGGWADGSCWSKVIPALQAKGFHVTAVQLPLTSLDDDVATVKRAIALEDGQVLLVGHSYGGAVITEAGNDPKVVGLVYVAAFAPDTGESLGSLLHSVQPSPLLGEAKPDANGFVKLTPRGVLEDFAQDLPETEKQTMVATQAPFFGKNFDTAISEPAWKSKPSWYVVATEDRAIPPDLQRTMAGKIKAKSVSVRSSHVAMLSHPDVVVEQIISAAGE